MMPKASRLSGPLAKPRTRMVSVPASEANAVADRVERIDTANSIRGNRHALFLDIAVFPVVLILLASFSAGIEGDEKYEKSLAPTLGRRFTKLDRKSTIRAISGLAQPFCGEIGGEWRYATGRFRRAKKEPLRGSFYPGSAFA